MNENDIKNNLDDVFMMIKQNMESSFHYLQKNPKDTKKIISIWKSYSNKVYKEFMLMSSKYDNHTVGKEITKMIMFK